MLLRILGKPKSAYPGDSSRHYNAQYPKVKNQQIPHRTSVSSYKNNSDYIDSTNTRRGWGAGWGRRQKVRRTQEPPACAPPPPTRSHKSPKQASNQASKQATYPPGGLIDLTSTSTTSASITSPRGETPPEPGAR